MPSKWPERGESDGPPEPWRGFLQGLDALLEPSTLKERYLTEFRPNLAAGAEKQDLTLKLWIEMCWP